MSVPPTAGPASGAANATSGAPSTNGTIEAAEGSTGTIGAGPKGSMTTFGLAIGSS